MKAKLILLILSVLMTGNMVAQGINITGVVSDYNGPVLGANVIIEGTSNGVITDINGKYSITAQKGNVLIFSYIGYITQRITITDKTVINVILQEDTQTLDEMVVVASGSSVSRDKSSRRERKSQSTPSKPSASAMSYAMYNYDAADNEEYSNTSENRFKSPLEDALSTFSIDVDAASYSNMRRIINQGKKPEPNTIRVEELINYFSYDLPAPKRKDLVNIVTEVGKCPWNKEHRLVRIGLKAREIPSDNLPPTNLVFLIDVSGSMYGPTRLDLVKSSLKLLVNNLRDEDRVAIVVYAGAAGQVLPSTPGSDKQKIKDALESLTAGGSTAGGAGIQLAYKTARSNFIKEGNNRIILCTDGDFNVGVSSTTDLETLIENERKSGVFLTILGYGMGNYKEDRMQVLAQKGNGNHAYIDNIQEANKVLVNEFGGTLFTVAKDVKLQVEFNPAHVQAYRLVGYETRLLNKEDFNDDTKDAGEMGAGHTVTAFYEIVPTGVKNNMIGTVDPLKYQPEANKEKDKSLTSTSPEMLTVKLRYKQPDRDVSQKMEIPLTDNKQDDVSDDFRFASAVAMFGQILKSSDFKGDGTYDNVIELAKKSTGKDEQGYRKEFIRLAEAVKGLD
ncbi:MAG: von Willebrand factor type A domain-containing protein [Tannerella sp.]|jgi:Ca-activated chloride channel family protein|nr:von Willebrand factor type A domain-containing protein [Tannerella sp.]